MTFTVVKKGYDKSEVDEYIAQTAAQHKDALETAKQRNVLLSDEIKALRAKVAGFSADEARVAALLVRCEDLLAKAERTAEQYAEEEMARLRAFRDKWTDYATHYLHTALPALTDKLEEMQSEYRDRVRATLTDNIFLLSDPLYAYHLDEEARTKDYSDKPLSIDDLLAKLREKP